MAMILMWRLDDLISAISFRKILKVSFKWHRPRTRPLLRDTENPKGGMGQFPAIVYACLSLGNRDRDKVRDSVRLWLTGGFSLTQKYFALIFFFDVTSTQFILKWIWCEKSVKFHGNMHFIHLTTFWKLILILKLINNNLSMRR